MIDKYLKPVLAEFITRANTIVPITQSILYGSQATGDATIDSDIDLLLITNQTIKDRLSLQLKLSDLAYDFLISSDLNLSPLILEESEWQAPMTFSNPFLLSNIKRTGVRLS